MKYIIPIALSMALAGCSYSVSDGYKIGHIQKVTTKGIINKVVEAELSTEGIKANQIDGRLSSVWTFNVLNPDVVKQLDEAGTKPIKVHYKQWLWKNPIYMTSSYEATKIEVNQ